MQLAATCAIATLTFDRPYLGSLGSKKPRRTTMPILQLALRILASLSFSLLLSSRLSEQTGKFCRLKNSRPKLASVVTEHDWVSFVFWTFANSMIRTRSIWKFQEPRNCRLGSGTFYVSKSSTGWNFHWKKKKNAGISRIKTSKVRWLEHSKR